MARHKFAVGAIAAIALCSTFWFLLDVLGAVSHLQVFGVAAFESRFDELRKTIRPHTTFGYISDNSPNDPSTQAEFFLTQYTLAPAIVKESTDERLIIANFHHNQPDPKLLHANKLTVIQNFNNGVVLCRKIGR